MKLKAFYIIVFLLFLGVITAIYFAGQHFHRNAGNSNSLVSLTPDLSPFQSYNRARVVSVQDNEIDLVEGLTPIRSAEVGLRILTGSEKNAEIGVRHVFELEGQRLQVGDIVVLGTITDPESPAQNEYVIIEKYRLPTLLVFVAIFLLVAILFGRWRGVSAVMGLLFSVLVLVYFIAPALLAGQNPALIVFIASCFVAVVSIFLAHGISRRTGIAIIATLASLGLAQGIAYIFVKYAGLLGNGSESTFLFQAGSLGTFNLQGLLLAGIIIGTLGVLDDITTAQVAAVDEIHKADTRVSFQELYKRGMSVGREHIASLINTLFLAYVGASLPLFLILVIDKSQPLWVILNSAFMAEEIVRTLVGSCALILAVPLSTVLSVYYFKKRSGT